MSSDDSVIIQPRGRIPSRGIVTPPGDKSVSHRLAMLAALAAGPSVIRNYLTAEDCLNTAYAVRALGATVERDGTTLRFTGTGGRYRRPASPLLDMGNSGTGMRLLSGLLAAHDFATELTGDESLLSRPMKRIRIPLEAMGAKLGLNGPKETGPIRLHGARLKGIHYTLPMASAQVKSCVLLAGLFADGTTSVTEPAPTRDHTERLLAAMNLPLTVGGLRISVSGSNSKPLQIPARDWLVPGDFSSAAFWLALGSMCEGSEIELRNVGINPRRTALLDVLRRMGAEIEIRDVTGSDWEPMATLRVRGRTLHGTQIGGNEIPNLIDEIPMLSAVAAMAEGTTTISDAEELRVKESDRIATVATSLRSFGVGVDERPDGLIVHGTRTLRGGGTINSNGDHRIAMAFSILALFADAPVTIERTACIATSYPSFWDDYRTLAS